MARKRMIDPEYWSDEAIGKWSLAGRLFYIGLWNFSDDMGRFKAHPDLLKSQIFPYDKRIDIERLKKEISSKIQWYEADGLKYGHIRNFLKHQRIERPTESKLPVPPQLTESSPNPHRIVGDDSEKVPPNIREDKLREDKLREDNIRQVVTDLNEVLGTDYKPDTPKTKELIKKLIEQGFTLENFKTVHRKMLRTWGNDEKMSKFLRPMTLYGNKFESYLQQKEVTTRLTDAGVKAYLIGQDWLRKQEEKDAGQEQVH